VVAILVGISSLFWPYYLDQIAGYYDRIFCLTFGILQATWLNYGRFQREEVLRHPEDHGILYLVGMLAVWIFSLILGANLYEVGISQ
jgi:hypothetical protein